MKETQDYLVKLKKCDLYVYSNPLKENNQIQYTSNKNKAKIFNSNDSLKIIERLDGHERNSNVSNQT